MSNKKTCLHCGKDWALSSFYSHRNPLINEQFGFCKKCVQGNVNLNDMDTLMDFLRTMDIPYLKDFWKQANDAKTETIGTYFKNLSLKQNRDLRFKDSDDITAKTNRAELAEIDYDDFEITNDIIRRWGRNLEVDDYIFLEEEFRNLGGDKAETTIQERLFKNMARTQWMAEKASDDGDHAKYEKMMKTLSTQMQDANVKPVQVKSASEDGGLASWGEWVKKIEETEPVTETTGEFEPKYIKDYVERWFITQMKRVFGKIKDEDIVKMDGEE
ncbi:hypothetical protein TU57_10980 [Bacillus cereus]|uniref:hypothetical protein n=1 Tax=Bacillus cereus group TaxID=86661 RepID=UPI00065BBB10|nr:MULTISPECIES: hypothetical protein [Bacillus cereus group]KMP65247.1 hypothetical protein TU57_10980 [Bacillus cereus]MDX5884880.1 hypothetical protein [Bacillus cereus group sp. BfR-BA-00999]